MSSSSSFQDHPLCLLDCGSEGRVIVSLESFLLFNRGMDEQLEQLEHQHVVPRDASGWPRTSACSCPITDSET